MTYAITGATGALGALAIQHLLKLKVPGSSIVALARDEGKAAALKAQGVQVRVANYNDRSSLERAFHGVDRVLLVSSNDIGNRVPQHKAVVDVAKAVGVKLLAYTSLIQADTSKSPLAPDHKATEEYIRASGVPFVFLRNNWYTENYLDDVKYAKTSGVIAAAVSTGKVASASRTDYAEAAARALIADGQAGKVYELSGAQAWTFPELAQAAGEVLGRSVKFQSLTVAERKAGLSAAGLPEGVVEFVTALDLGAEAGTLAKVSPDLEKLLGRKPISLKDGLKLALG